MTLTEEVGNGAGCDVHGFLQIQVLHATQEKVYSGSWDTAHVLIHTVYMIVTFWFKLSSCLRETQCVGFRGGIKLFFVHVCDAHINFLPCPAVLSVACIVVVVYVVFRSVFRSATLLLSLLKSGPNKRSDIYPSVWLV